VALVWLSGTRVAMEEISARPAPWSSYGAHSNLCINQISAGRPRAKESVSAEIAEREHVGSLAMSEAGRIGCGFHAVEGRAPWRALQAERTKFWITNAPEADTVVVYARTSSAPNGISAFIVERA